ncbi:NB-ARC domain-containing protein [Kineococcus aurantiacus]|uniref:NB-ARC domain-containing protein n=1 Tax=Kineococcus aurantiacus TaxID=37633 RepID=UPI0015C9B5B2
MGRKSDTTALEELLVGSRRRTEGHPAVLLHGKPGCGKSAIAVHVAKRLVATGRFRSVYVNLGGTTHRPKTVRAVIEEVLTSLGEDVASIPSSDGARQAMYRRVLSAYPTLLLLDDAGKDQNLAALLPGARTPVVITARTKFSHIVELVPRRIDVMTEAEASDLLIHLSGREPGTLLREQVVELATQVGCLPLALVIVSAILRRRTTTSASALARELRDESTRLSKLRTSEDLDLRSALSVSVAALTDAEAEVFRRWGVVNASTLPDAVARRLSPRDAESSRAALDGLFECQLIDALSGDRWGMHDLIRLYALEEGSHEPPAARLALQKEILTAYGVEALGKRRVLVGHRDWAWDSNSLDVEGLPLAAQREVPEDGREETAAPAAPPFPVMRIQSVTVDSRVMEAVEHQRGVLSWFMAEQNTIDLLLALAGELRLIEPLCDVTLSRDSVWSLLGNHQARVQPLEVAAELAKEAGLRERGAVLTYALGNAYRHMGRPVDAMRSLVESEDLLAAQGNRRGTAHAVTQQGHVLRESRNRDEAWRRYEHAADLMAAADPGLGLSEVQSNLSILLKEEGDLDGAEEMAREALRRAETTQNPTLSSLKEYGWIMSNLGAVLGRRGRVLEAQDAHSSSLQAFVLVNNRIGQGHALRNAGVSASRLGDPRRGEELLKLSLHVFSLVGYRDGEVKALFSLAQTSRKQGHPLRAAAYVWRAARRRHPAGRSKNLRRTPTPLRGRVAAPAIGQHPPSSDMRGLDSM